MHGSGFGKDSGFHLSSAAEIACRQPPDTEGKLLLGNSDGGTFFTHGAGGGKTAVPSMHDEELVSAGNGDIAYQIGVEIPHADCGCRFRKRDHFRRGSEGAVRAFIDEKFGNSLCLDCRNQVDQSIRTVDLGRV
ncbi:MAG: hypothetical protein IANPNBLG_04674 [Bryobacteraceae bacterium]|nr:hypothetical protein [Bryobacteraceae bacterium]